MKLRHSSIKKEAHGFKEPEILMFLFNKSEDIVVFVVVVFAIVVFIMVECASKVAHVVFSDVFALKLST
jgi:hypothetical protein